MKRWIVLAAGLLFALAANAADSVRFGSKLVTLGDTEGRVYQVAGQPTRTVQLQTKFGGAAGYRLDYVSDRKTVQITISGGRVVSIEELFS